MFIEASLFNRNRHYINTNKIVYIRPNMNDENKTELVLTDGSIALIDNDVQEVRRLLNQLERDAHAAG